MKRIGLFLITICSVLAVVAAELPTYFSKWEKLPSKQLMDMGSRFAEFENKADSALVCFTIVAGRYRDNLPPEERHHTIIAQVGKWYVYFFRYFDYSKSYESLQRAYELAKMNGEQLQRIYLNYGCMYQTIAEQSGDMKPNRKAADYYKKAIEEAAKHNELATLNMAIQNLCTVSHSLGCLGTIAPYINLYNSKVKDKRDPGYQYTLLLYKGLLAIEKRQYDKAIAHFDKQKSLIKQDITFSRYNHVTKVNIAKALAGMGKMQQAINLLHEAERITNKYDIKDGKLEIYKLLAEYSERMHLDQQTEAYRNKFFRLKDTLLNYRQMASVQELQFLGEMKAMDEKLAQMDMERRHQNTVTAIVVGIAAVVLLFLLLIWLKNKKLQKANKSLYEKNISMLQREEDERNRRKAYEEALEQMKSKLQQQEKATAHTHAPQEAEDAQTDRATKKYKDSWLDEAGKAELEAKMLDIIESTDEIFKSDFSADRLAQLTGIKYRYLSQVINERHGVNFNTFINEYRIKEACKRFNDVAHYGNHTIEGIANGVGFNSRTSFITAFKKFTGLTPSEYQKMAKQRQQTV